MTDDEFWASSYRKICFLIGKLGEEYDVDKPKPQQVKTISSMKEITGWC